ncbi:MAG: hypothetical protein ACD_46C00628G0006 [uncultured bacterium]|nr:MAG: hypothetical protein ACD_46C00628G0006 [uncultured bacterium]
MLKNLFGLFNTQNKFNTEIEFVTLWEKMNNDIHHEIEKYKDTLTDLNEVRNLYFAHLSELSNILSGKNLLTERVQDAVAFSTEFNENYIVPAIEKIKKKIIKSSNSIFIYGKNHQIPKLSEEYQSAWRINNDLLSLSSMLQNNPNLANLIYSAPLDENGEVMNKIIKEWQEDRKRIINQEEEIKGEQDSVLSDFSRSSLFKIDNKSFGDEKKENKDKNAIIILSNMFDRLVDKAKGYESKDKEKLKNWLKINGGQQILGFIQLLVGSGYFSQPAIMGTAPNAVNNWKVDKYGKIIFYFEADVEVLKVGETAHIRMADGSRDVGMETYNAMRDTKKILPQAHIVSEVQLDLEHGKVVPKVVRLDVTIYDSTLLKSPILEEPQQVLSDTGEKFKRL